MALASMNGFELAGRSSKSNLVVPSDSGLTALLFAQSKFRPSMNEAPVPCRVLKRFWRTQALRKVSYLLFASLRCRIDS